MVRKILIGVFGVLVLLVAAAAIYVAARQNVRYDVPFPAIAASTDSSVIERGHYIVANVANCASCHGDPAEAPAIARGDDVPLSGGRVWNIPPGTFHTPNITSDRATGIGAIPDEAIARAIRDGVKHDGRVLLPFMALQGLSDEDVLAVLSYLRTLPPVPKAVPAHQPNLLGRILIATVLSKPVGPATTPPHESPAGPTVENGRYLVVSVAGCGGCHTQHNPQTDEVIGPELAGARERVPDEANPKRFWSPPNLTSAKTGRLAIFSEDAFVARIRGGRIIPGSPMPWENFRRMKEDDLRAIYRYLATVPPVENDPGPPFVDKP